MRRVLLLLAGVSALVMLPVAARVQAAPALLRARSDPYAGLIADAARRFQLPAALIRAVMRIESGGNRRAVSPAGAMGLMQLMPETWATFRIRYRLGRDPFDPHDNIFAAAAFLRELRDRYGSPDFLAAYNSGPARYEAYRDRHRPLPAETVAYVKALAAFVEGGERDSRILLAAVEPISSARASLFVKRSTSPETVEDALVGGRSMRARPVIAVRDLSGIAPRSDGLFVPTSAARRKP